MSKQLRPRLNEAEHEYRAYLKAANNVGIIGDTHEPYCHPDYAQFCLETFDRFHVDVVVHIGDLLDAHTISQHPKSPEALSPAEEFKQAKERLAKWYELFPEVKMCLGNHDERIVKAAASSNLPKMLVKTLPEAFDMPKGWEISDKFIIDGVLYEHGTGSSGANAHVTRALHNMMSTVIGHVHSYGGCQNWTNSEGKRMFGLQVGCGIDISKVAFSYAKSYPKKPTLGCGVVLGGTTPIFIPM